MLGQAKYRLLGPRIFRGPENKEESKHSFLGAGERLPGTLSLEGLGSFGCGLPKVVLFLSLFAGSGSKTVKET